MCRPMKLTHTREGDKLFLVNIIGQLTSLESLTIIRNTRCAAHLSDVLVEAMFFLADAYMSMSWYDMLR
jgi:hypothetical protein